MHAVAGELLQKLGTSGAPLAEGLLLRLGEICAGASDAAEEEAALDQATSRDALAAQTALGQGIRSMGPQAILQVLPLGLVEASQLTFTMPVVDLGLTCAALSLSASLYCCFRKEDIIPKYTLASFQLRLGC